MSSIAYRSTLTGVLKTVVVVVLLTGVLRKVAVVVLLGFVGLTAGFVYGTFVPPTYGATIVLQAESSYRFPARYSSAPDLVRLMRGKNRGVRVVAHGERVVELSTNGSLRDAAKKATGMRRVSLHYAVSMVLLVAGRLPKVTFHGTASRLPDGLFGLLAGMSAALGLLSRSLRLYRTS